MNVAAAVLLSILAVQAEQPSTTAPGAENAPDFVVPDADKPPPGSPAEQALWRSGLESTRRLHAVRVASTRLQQRLRYTGTEKQLDALARGATPAAAEATALQARLRSAWQHNIQTLTKPWPVDPTRGCMATFVDYELQLYNHNPQGREARLGMLGKELGNCLQRLESIRSEMDGANRAFEQAIADAEKLVSSAGPKRSAEAPASAPAAAKTPEVAK